MSKQATKLERKIEPKRRSQNKRQKDKAKWRIESEMRKI